MTPDKPTYYVNAAGWASSESEAARRSRNLAWTAAGAVGLIAILEALALISLTPLKSVKVVPVLVDRQTGFVEVLRDGGRQAITPEAALTRSMLAQFVLAREGFNITTIGADYRKVMLWSAGSARSGYAALMLAQNPASPLRIYPRSTIVEGVVESVSDLSANTALVRFTTRRHDGEAQPGPPNYYAAVITYQYSRGPLRVEDRLANPLGFQVLRYQRDDEAAPPPSPPASSTATGDQGARGGPGGAPAALRPQQRPE